MGRRRKSLVIGKRNCRCSCALVCPHHLVGAWAANGLLLFFIIIILFNLAKGRTPDCHCFGQLHAAPVGWPTIIRNGLLMAVAGFIIWQGPIYREVGIIGLVAGLKGLSGDQPLSLPAGVGVVIMAIMAMEGWVIGHLWRQQQRLLRRIETVEAQALRGLPVGTPAPVFSLRSTTGEIVTSESLLANRKWVILFFFEPDCGPCQMMMPHMIHWQQEYMNQLIIAFIGRNLAKIVEKNNYGGLALLVQNDREVAQSYKVRGIPAAVLIQPNGRVGAPMALGQEAITRLITDTVKVSHRRADRG